MAVIINASTSTGLVQSADTSGIIQFQSNGSTKATLNSSGFSYPGGVLQVVNASNSSRSTASQQTWTSVVSASITPKSSSSRILILGQIHAGNGSASNSIGLRIYRDSTVIGSGTGTVDAHSGENLQVGNPWMTATMVAHFIDSPATTSSISYSLRAASWENNLIINSSNSDSSAFSSGNVYGTSQIILMEIAA
jgi:hypothetical protein